MVYFTKIVIASIVFATGCIPFLQPQQRTAYSITNCGISSTIDGHQLAVSVRCPRGMPYRISLLQEPSCGAARTLSSGRTGRKIRYVFLTPDRNGVWCDGTKGTVAVSAIADGGTQHYIAVPSVLDARVAAADLNAAEYVDTVVVYVERR